MSKTLNGKMPGGAILLAAAVAALFASAAVAQQAAPDLAEFGYTQVVASEELEPGQAATVGSGQIKAQVPAEAFTEPVRFEILQGDNATFQPFAPAGDAVLTNFAFRVTNLETGELVGMFGAPVTAVISDPGISQESEYYDVQPTSPVEITENPVAPSIDGDVITHPNKGAPVGWVVLNPAPAALAETGGPSPALLVGGAAALMLLGIAAALVTLRRQAA